MRNLFKLFTVILLFSCNKNEEPQEEVKNDSAGEYSAADTLVKISMMANTVEDPNHDPNLYSEIDISSCTPQTGIKEKNPPRRRAGI